MANYTQASLQVIRQSSFQILDGKYIYCKVKSFPKGRHHFLLTCDDEEITIVTTEERLDELSLIERNKDSYRLIALNVKVPFYSVGFLATVSDAFASRGMNVLLVSTFSKDYLLIKEDLIDTAKTVLMELGFRRRMPERGTLPD
jgi:hypothetical protein